MTESSGVAPPVRTEPAAGDLNGSVSTRMQVHWCRTGSRRATGSADRRTSALPRVQWWRGRDGRRSTGCALLTAGAAGGRPGARWAALPQKDEQQMVAGSGVGLPLRGGESRRPSPRAGSIPSSGWWVGGGFSCARDVFAVPTSPPAGVLPSERGHPSPRPDGESRPAGPSGSLEQQIHLCLGLTRGDPILNRVAAAVNERAPEPTGAEASITLP